MAVAWSLGQITNNEDANQAVHIIGTVNHHNVQHGTATSTEAEIIYKTTANGTVILPEIETLPPGQPLREFKISIARTTFRNEGWFAATNRNFTELS